MRLLLTLALLLFLTPAVRADDDPEPPGSTTGDLKLLQGTWRVTSLQLRGAPAGGPGVDGKKMTLTFAKDKVTSAQDGKDQKEHTVKLDAKKTPKHIDVTQKGGQTAPGIYKIEKDQLTICFHVKPDAKARPKGFDEQEAVIMVLKKEKK